MPLLNCRAGFAGALVAALTIVFGYAATAQEKSTKVEVDAVIAEPLSQTMPVLGRFVARQAGPVAALVGGPVEEILVDVGDRVEEGDVLVRLSTDVTVGVRNLREAELAEKKAAAGSAQANLRRARQEMARLENLKSSAAFSQASYDDKRAEVASFESLLAEAKAAIVRAEANLKLAELDMQRSEIRAPYNGVVVDRKAVPGAFITPGAPVVGIVNDEDMEIEADVPSDRLTGLAPGRAVRAKLDDGRSVMAVVRAVIPTENALTRTRPVRFAPQLADPGPRHFATDQSVTVMLPIGEPREIVSVHKDAMIARGEDYIVYVVEDGKAQSRGIQVGEAVGKRFEVLSGLAPGDLVVTRGNERLRPGEAVAFEAPARGDG